MHTNDIHGHFAAERAAWRQDSAMVGGFAVLSGALDSVRKSDDRTIYLDAGDLMTGNPICNMEVDGLKGAALLHMLKLCKCDAIEVGNHEFDLGPEHLRDFLATTDVSWVCSNVQEKSDHKAICAEYRIIERDGLKIGVIGLILTDLAGVVSQHAIEDFNVLDAAAAAQPMIDEIDPATDVIVLLTHNGVDNDIDLARHVSNCDVIVGGHSHTRLKEPLVENGVIIVQAGSFLKNLGVLKLRVKHDKVADFDGKLVELDVARFAPDSEISDYCKTYEDQISREYGEIIATTSSNLTREYAATSPLGNLLCDLLRQHYETDIALVNSGGIRKDIPAGPIRKLDIVEMLPFTNSVMTFELSGREILLFANQQARAQIGGKSETLQMSGLEISYAEKSGEPNDIEVLVNGLPVDADQNYRGVSIDYVLKSQAEQYLGFVPQQTQDTGVQFSDFIMSSLASANQPISPITEKRLIRK
ncbi:MAG: bifunctional metallophosphatase/5'-nucleotidase [Calditrichaeota bacterium]|nr:bifunctional metallophosphatase/5'-nucleotidase [Calditrichota bacterium]